MDSVLRPRDIQARIRAGESPEDVAAAAQTSLDRIMGFATPVLAERAYQAQLAQKASVRRRAALGPVGHLGEAVTSFLEPHGLGADDVEWDAWRREDGRWTVLATYLSGAAQQTARFTYDTQGRFVVADNDEARTLVGERTPPAAASTVATDEPSSAVAEAGEDGSSADPAVSGDPAQLALGDDTLGMVLGRSPDDTDDPDDPDDTADTADTADPDADAASDVADAAPAARRELPPDEATIDLTDTSNRLRGPAGPGAGTGDADWMATQASERPATRTPAPSARTREEKPAAHEDEPFDALFEAPEPPAEPPVTEAPTEPVGDPAADGSDEGAGDTEEAPSRKQPAKARRRASVPSWDEIMFGTPKDG